MGLFFRLSGGFCKAKLNWFCSTPLHIRGAAELIASGERCWSKEDVSSSEVGESFLPKSSFFSGSVVAEPEEEYCFR